MPSVQRLRTTHVGSLPRSQPVVDQIFTREKGEPVDEATFDAIMAAAIDGCVAARWPQAWTSSATAR
jgi:methionine synthase II (cobalamin-independent)